MKDLPKKWKKIEKMITDGIKIPTLKIERILHKDKKKKDQQPIKNKIKRNIGCKRYNKKIQDYNHTCVLISCERRRGEQCK